MREDQWSWTVEIDGVSYGIWDSKTGGATTASNTKFRPGAMGKTKALGGSRSRDDITLSHLYDLFINQREAELEAKVGKGRVKAVGTPLDMDGNPLVGGKQKVYTGILNGFTPPDHDSESEDPSKCEIEIAVDGV